MWFHSAVAAQLDVPTGSDRSRNAKSETSCGSELIAAPPDRMNLPAGHETEASTDPDVALALFTGTVFES